MNRAPIALFALSLVAPYLMAQRADGSIAYDSRSVSAGMTSNTGIFGPWKNVNGGVCYPAPYYEYCNYDYTHALDLYRLWTYRTFLNSMNESDLSHQSKTKELPEPPPPPPPPPPPATPVVHEYHWPDDANTATTFSIVTSSGIVYLATMVWIEGGDVHFNSVEGGVRQIPLASLSMSLTETANARKGLNLPLPGAQALRPSIIASNISPTDYP